MPDPKDSRKIDNDMRRWEEKLFQADWYNDRYGTEIRGFIRSLLSQERVAIDIESLIKEAQKQAEEKLSKIHEIREEEAIEKARKEEKLAWLENKRCFSCGKEIAPDEFTSTCKDCWELT